MSKQETKLPNRPIKNLNVQGTKLNKPTGNVKVHKIELMKPQLSKLGLKPTIEVGTLSTLGEVALYFESRPTELLLR